MSTSQPLPAASPMADAAAASPNRPVPSAVDELHYLIRAQYKLVYVVSAEEERVERWLRDQIGRAHV